MAVNLKPPESLLPVAGVRLGTAEAAIKKPGRQDLLLIELAEGSTVAGVFTRNAFCAAPVLLCREILAGTQAVRGLLVNSGNANAGTGEAGMDAARATADFASQTLGGGAVLPFSTGVIGQALPVQKIETAIPHALAALDANGWRAAAEDIMTTDTVAKGASREVQINGETVTVTGISKGAGMIRPDMATMLAFVGTDAKLSPAATERCLRDAVEVSFNCITVDGDTSTNDSAMLFATGAAGDTIEVGDAAFETVAAAVREVCLELAQAIVRDGEGATRFITIAVSGAGSEAEARLAADAVAHSPLVKTACFAGDANWGRILAAVGRSGVPALDVSRIRIAIDEVLLIEDGAPAVSYREELGAAVFARPEFSIQIDLGRGEAGVTIWTCDFSYDYVRINAEYRT